MCGIVGIISRTVDGHCAVVNNQANVLELIRHRGPDMHGEYTSGRVWLGHVRLSILDLSEAAKQPMVTKDGRFVISYNGEVYNFMELARDFALDSLRTHSDTEVILRAFAKYGVDVFSQLNGMFAFAIYDRQQQKLWLVRDRLGIKPLYFSFDAQGLSFGSEIKTINALVKDSPLCELSSLHEWLFYGNTLGERTLYKGIHKLLPGHYLELDLDTFTHKIIEYWSPRQQAALLQIKLPKNEHASNVRNLLEQAVKRQLVSDVPVGVFLSGGIDSSAITAFATKHYEGKIATYSAGFDFDTGVNELPKARKVAEHYGTDHHEIHISGFDIADVVEKMVYHHDMPFSDAANIPLFLMATQISGQTKVVLQGDGGDELFGGYRRYVTLGFLNVLRPLARIGQYVNKLTPRTTHYHRRQRYLHALGADSIAANMALLLTEEDGNSHPASMFSAAMQKEIEKSDPYLRYRQCQSYFENQDIINQMALVDAMIILPDIFLEKVDRSTMAASLEVRVPFLDNDLVEYCMRIPGYCKVPHGQKKGLLKQALSGIVPHEILYGPKTGFGVPYGYWLRGSLKSLFYDHLSLIQKKHPGLLNSTIINVWYQEHESRKRDSSFRLWKTLNFMIWANQTHVNFR